MRNRKDLYNIDNFTMSQIICALDFKRDLIYKDLESVNNFNPTDTLDNFIRNFNKKTNYNKALFDFISFINESRGFNLNINKIKSWSEEEISLFKEYTHQDFWYYRISLFKNGLISIKEKPRKKEIINWGFPDPSINEFLNNMPLEFSNKVRDIIKNNYEAVKNYIYIEEGNDIESILEFKKEIFEKDTIFNKFYNIKLEGGGKGEIIVAFLYRGIISGMSNDYDIKLYNGKRIEIKSLGKSLSFRIGTKGSLGNCEFYYGIIEMRNVLNYLIKQIGYDDFKKAVGSNNFYELCSQFLKKGDFKSERAISSAIDSAEINNERLNLIRLLFYGAHILTKNYDENKNPIYLDVFTKKYVIEDDNKRTLINALKACKYVKEPWKFTEDIEKAKEDIFKDIDYIICFNEKFCDINIYTYKNVHELKVDSISQNGLKLIERKYKKERNISIDKAHELWVESTDNYSFDDFYEFYTKLVLNDTKQEVECLAL